MAQQEGALQQTMQPLVFFPGGMSSIIDIEVSFCRDNILLPLLLIGFPFRASSCLLLDDDILVFCGIH